MSDAVAQEALDTLHGLALRSESAEAVDPLVSEVRLNMQSLPDPGLPIVLTVKIDVDGNGSTRYLGDPAHAVATLRRIADQIEAETTLL